MADAPISRGSSRIDAARSSRNITASAKIAATIRPDLRSGEATTDARDVAAMARQIRATRMPGTRETGGRLFVPKTARDLAAIYTAIALELFSQYELGYMPVRAGAEGGFRRVAVRLRPQANVIARTRSGYYASRARPGM